MLKPKTHGMPLEIRSFTGNDGNRYLVSPTRKGSFQTFVEVEAKQAARECGAEEGADPRQMWKSI